MDKHPFVMVKTPEGSRIITLVESDRVNIDGYRWTREYLDTGYDLVPNQRRNFPYYESKNG